MSHLKPGLNEPFYKWLDEVRKAIRKEKELKEKLAYYNVKLIGYKGVVYDRIGSAGTAGGEKDLYYWMDKIRRIEIKLNLVSTIIAEYHALVVALDEMHRLFLNEVILLQKPSSRRSLHYGFLNDIIRMWSKIVKSNS
jgi:hypothetical protein